MLSNYDACCISPSELQHRATITFKVHRHRLTAAFLGQVRIIYYTYNGRTASGTDYKQKGVNLALQERCQILCNKGS